MGTTGHHIACLHYNHINRDIARLLLGKRHQSISTIWFQSRQGFLGTDALPLQPAVIWAGFLGEQSRSCVSLHDGYLATKEPLPGKAIPDRVSVGES